MQMMLYVLMVGLLPGESILNVSSATCRCLVSFTLDVHNDKVDKLTFTVVCNVQFFLQHTL